MLLEAVCLRLKRMLGLRIWSKGCHGFRCNRSNNWNRTDFGYTRGPDLEVRNGSTSLLPGPFEMPLSCLMTSCSLQLVRFVVFKNSGTHTSFWAGYGIRKPSTTSENQPRAQAFKDWSNERFCLLLIHRSLIVFLIQRVSWRPLLKLNFVDVCRGFHLWKY